MSAAELEVVERVYDNVTTHQLTEADLRELDATLKAYHLRTGEPLSRERAAPLIALARLSSTYDLAHAEASLMSFDRGEPVYSSEWKRLRRQAREAGFAWPEKLAMDSALIRAVADRSTYTDPVGNVYGPFQRSYLLEVQRQAKQFVENTDKYIAVLEENIEER